MLTYKNLAILGTSHIAKESVIKVKGAIRNLKPDIIALELDKERLPSLLSKKRKISLSSIKKLGLKAFFLNLLGSYIEKSLSKKTGILPGTEMRAAFLLAKKHKIQIFLIDQPIKITLNNLTSKITRKEKFQFLKDIFSSIIFRKRQITFNLNEVPSEKIINELIKEIKSKYPTVYKILVEERNIYMTKVLNKIMNTYKNKRILAIVGAGHAKDIVGELKSMKN